MMIVCAVFLFLIWFILKQGQKSFKKFCLLLGQLSFKKNCFEISWPLIKLKNGHLFVLFFSLVHGGSKFEVFCIFRRFYQPYLLVRRDASINIFNSNDATQYQSCSQALWSLGKICWKWSFQCISSDRQTTLNCQKIFIAGKVLLDCKTKK